MWFLSKFGSKSRIINKNRQRKLIFYKLERKNGQKHRGLVNGENAIRMQHLSVTLFFLLCNYSIPVLHKLLLIENENVNYCVKTGFITIFCNIVYRNLKYEVLLCTQNRGKNQYYTSDHAVVTRQRCAQQGNLR